MIAFVRDCMYVLSEQNRNKFKIETFQISFKVFVFTSWAVFSNFKANNGNESPGCWSNDYPLQCGGWPHGGPS